MPRLCHSALTVSRLQLLYVVQNVLMFEVENYVPRPARNQSIPLYHNSIEHRLHP